MSVTIPLTDAESCFVGSLLHRRLDGLRRNLRMTIAETSASIERARLIADQHFQRNHVDIVDVTEDRR